MSKSRYTTFVRINLVSLLMCGVANYAHQSAWAEPSVMPSLTGNDTVTIGDDGLQLTHKGNFVFDGTLTGAGGLDLAGGGQKQTLSGTNSYRGATTVNSWNTIQIGRWFSPDPASLGSTPSISLKSDSWLAIILGKGTNDFSHMSQVISGDGSVAFNGSDYNSKGEPNTFFYTSSYQGINYNAASRDNTITVIDGKDPNFQYTGETDINYGVLKIKNGTDVLNRSSSVRVGYAGVLDLSDESLSKDGSNVQVNAIVSDKANKELDGLVKIGSHTLEISNPNNKELQYAGGIGAEGDTGGLVLDKGTMVVMGNNHYTGDTTLNNGVHLELNGSSESKQVNVSNGSTFTGSNINKSNINVDSGSTIGPTKTFAQQPTLNITGNLTVNNSTIDLSTQKSFSTAFNPVGNGPSIGAEDQGTSTPSNLDSVDNIGKGLTLFSGRRSQGIIYVNGDIQLSNSKIITDDLSGELGSGVQSILISPRVSSSDVNATLMLGNNTASSNKLQYDTGVLNLVTQQGSDKLSFWNGNNNTTNAVSGGEGTWSQQGTSTNTNWVDQNGQNSTTSKALDFAIFQQNGGKVNVQGTVTVTGMQFAVKGGSGIASSGNYYHLADGGNGVIQLAGSTEYDDPAAYGVSSKESSDNKNELLSNHAGGISIIRVGDGTGDSYGETATIDPKIVDADNNKPTTLVKTDVGILVLNNTANSYSGGTVVTNGTLQIPDEKALGTEMLSLNGGALALGASADIKSHDILLSNNHGASGGQINLAGYNSTISSSISGDGSLVIASYDPKTGNVVSGNGSPTLNLSGENTYKGDTLIEGMGGDNNPQGGVKGQLTINANSTNAFGNYSGDSAKNGSGSKIYANADSVVNINGSDTSLGYHTVFVTSSTLNFKDRSTAGHALIETNSAQSGASQQKDDSQGALIHFGDGSSAENATIINKGAGDNHYSKVLFDGTATAENANIINTEPSSQQKNVIEFDGKSKAGASLISNIGSYVVFKGFSDASTATINNSGEEDGNSSNVDISGVNTSDKTLHIGSLTGDKATIYQLGSNTLAVGGIGKSGDLLGTITDNGQGGGFTKEGDGVLNLKTTNSYTGDTTNNSGTLNVLTNINGNFISNNQSTSNVGFSDGQNVIVAGETTNNGSTLNVNGATLKKDVTNNNGHMDLQENTNVNGKTINSGASAVLIANHAYLQTVENNTGKTTLANTTATSVVSSNGTTELQGGTKVSGDATQHDGTFQLDGSSVVEGNVTQEKGGMFLQKGSSIQGTLNVNGGSFQTVSSGSNTNASVGSLQGNSNGILNETMNLNGNTSNEYNGVLSGQGGLTLKENDTTNAIQTLSGNNTYSGTTTIDKGRTLQLTGNGRLLDGFSSQDVNTYVQNNGTLDVANNANARISSPSINDKYSLREKVHGSGSLKQDSDGITELLSGSDYTGGTTATKGVVQFDAGSEVGNSNAVNDFRSGSTLAGQGSVVGNTTIDDGATLQTGDYERTSYIPQNFTINGNLELNNGATTLIRANDQAAIDSATGQQAILHSAKYGDYNQLQSDLLTVTGTAQLGGRLNLDIQGLANLQPGEGYRIIRVEGGVTKDASNNKTTFASSNNMTVGGFGDRYAYLEPKISIDQGGNNEDYVDILLGLKAGGFSKPGNTPNEKTPGHGLDNLPDSPFKKAVQATPSGDVRRVLNNLSGELHASIRTGLIQDVFFIRNAALNRMANDDCAYGRLGQSVYDMKTHHKNDDACYVDHIILWGQAYGSLGHNNGDGNVAGMNHNTAGFILGADTPIRGTNWHTGGLVAYGHSAFNVGERSSSGNSNNITVGGYAGTHWGQFHLRLGATYSWNLINTRRQIAVGTYGGRVNSHYLGGTAQGFAELGYRVRVGRTVLEPFMNVTYVNMQTNHFRERGNDAALLGRGRDTGVTFSSFGLRTGTNFTIGKMLVMPHAMVAYRHGYGRLGSQMRAGFSAAGRDNDMNVSGILLSNNTAVVETGVTARVTKRIDIDLSYVGQYGNQSVDSGATGSFRMYF